MIDVATNEAIKRINRILAGVPGGAEKAITSLVTRARSTVKETAVKSITNVYDIKPNDIRDRKNTTINMRTKKFDGGVVGEVSFSGGKIPLYRFGVRPKHVTKMKSKVPVLIGNKWLMFAPSKPVNARLMKSKSFTTIKNSFVAEMKNGHTGIFERSDIDRLPMNEKMGLSTPQMAANAVVLEEVEAAAMEAINNRMEHEISRILNGYT